MAECEAVEDRYVLHERIGRGSFGEVWRGQDRQTGEVVAIKVIDLDQAEDEIDDIVQEINVMALCESAFVTQYYGSHVSGSQLYIIMEYVGGGSILDMMDAFPLTEPYIKTILHDVLRGLDYLHTEGKIHRDIKAANILYSNEGVVKLADFGTSKKIADVANLSVGLKSLVGTPYMMAPEVIRQTGHSLPADIWSLACVIWEMATTKHPFTQYTDRMVAMYNIAHAKTPPDPPDVLSESAKDFVRRCMQIEAKKRATTSELLAHAFISQVERKTNLSSPEIGRAHV